MLKIIFFLYLSMIAMFAGGQTLHYDVVKGGNKIGDMNVTRVYDDDKEIIDFKTETEFKIFLLSFEVEYYLHEEFENGVLEKGKGYSSLNNALQSDYSIKRKDNSYKLVISEIPNTINASKIEYTVSKIYFEEPINKQPVFSQHFGTYLEFIEVGEHYYRLQSPDGVNYYRYDYGICTEVKVSRDFGTWYFLLKPESYIIVKNKADSLGN